MLKDMVYIIEDPHYVRVVTGHIGNSHLSHRSEISSVFKSLELTQLVDLCVTAAISKLVYKDKYILQPPYDGIVTTDIEYESEYILEDTKMLLTSHKIMIDANYSSVNAVLVHGCIYIFLRKGDRI